MLFELGLVNKDDQSKNKKPLYITQYNEKFGDRNEFVDENLRIINDEGINDSYLNKNLKMTPGPFGFIELEEKNIPGGLGSEYEIPIIITLLMKGHDVLYKPDTTTPDDYASIASYGETNLEFVFFPEIPKFEPESRIWEHHILKPSIDISKPILFRAKYSPINYPQKQLDEGKQSILINALSMFNSIKSFSDYLHDGNYSILSRIRIGYVLKKTGRGYGKYGGSINDEYDEYEDGLKLLYGNFMDKKIGGMRRMKFLTRKRRNNKKSKSRKQRM
jgi:hypothetical protein